MSTEPKMTPWSEKGQRPHHPGVYQVDHRKDPFDGAWYALWRNNTWHWAYDSIKYAAREPDPITVVNDGWSPATPSKLMADHFHVAGKWRGLARKP